MPSNISSNDIIARCQEKYGSLSSPDFSFVKQSVERNPYSGLMGQLVKFLEVIDNTDTNDDVSFGHLLQKNERQWSLQLSMVGPYGLLMRVAEPSGEILTSASRGLSDVERRIVDLLRLEGVQLLDRQTLEEPIALRLNNAEPEETRLYQALFTDVSQLPWQD
jgi:hypothetical protein